ncbi:AMP-binding protein, partial [Mycobacterium sp.]|uniref:AMP-binding protein n=1 Tax=Mycobacterium sp. TaxID=1785 RepID=UPI003C77DFB4
MKSYDAGPISPPLLEETIGDNFERTVATHPDVEALVDVIAERRWTYAELNAEIDLIARGLMSLGVQHGDRVGVWSPNCAEWVMTQYATVKTGAILVNINPAYRTHELGYVLDQSGVRMLIAATAFKSSDYRAMVEEVRPNATDLRDVVFLDTDDWINLRDRAELVSPDALRSRMAALDNREPINI